MRHTLRPVLGILGAVLLTGCPKVATLDVQPGATTQDLTFVMNELRMPERALPRFGGISVRPRGCGREDSASRSPVWVLTANDGVGLQPAPRTIRYGQGLSGYTAESGPTPLSVGCYEATLLTAGYTGAVRFEVLASGAVRAVGAGAE